MAITLQVNRFLGALTNLVAYSQVVDTLEGGQVNRFVDSCQDINAENGSGKVVLSANVLTVQDLSGTSSLLTPTLPNVDEQYIPVTNYKVIPLTTNEYLMRGAFVDEGQCANFIGYLKSVMQATKAIYLYKQLISIIEDYVPTLETQTITVNLINTTGLTDPMQLQSAMTYNANAINKELIKLLQSMSAPTSKYNDLGFTEIIDFSNMKWLTTSTADANLLVDSLATLLNSGKIADAQKWKETIVIPDDQFTSVGNLLGWFMHIKKVQFGYFYQVATSFFDGSTLNQQDWLHFAYYMGTIDALPCVKLEASYSITPAPLA